MGTGSDDATKTTAASKLARQVGASMPLEMLARAGLIAYGLIHILVGWLALLMAWGGSTAASSDLSGALRTVAKQPFGYTMLWLVAVCLVALALWQVSESVWGHRNREGAKRERVVWLLVDELHRHIALEEYELFPAAARVLDRPDCQVPNRHSSSGTNGAKL